MELKETLKTGKAKGVLIKIIDNPAINLLAKEAGMDFLFYDCEHGMISYEKLHDLILMGNASDIPSIVRVAQLSRRDVSQALDCGASGVMVPMIETKEQAEQLVAWSKYPPIGSRSYSGGANTHYRPSGNHAANMRELNERTLTIAQIETVRGVENVEAILSVPGVDAAIVGPCDLGISMGNPDNVMDEGELALIERVAAACKRQNKAFGIIGGMVLQQRFAHTVDLLVAAIDVNLLREAMQRAVRQYEQLTPEAGKTA